MALSGSIITESSKGRSVTLNWVAVQDKENNKSILTWELVGSGSATGWVAVNEIRITIDGVQSFYRNESNQTICYQGTKIASGTEIITHSSDGTKSFIIKVEAGIYQWEINCVGSKIFTLDAIARASEITYASNIILGNSCNIVWTPASSLFTFKLRFNLGNWTYDTEIIKPETTSEFRYRDFDLPLIIADQLPNSKSGTMNVYLYTYNNDVQVGSATNRTFIVLVPNDIIPTINNVSANIINENKIIDDWNVAVAGYTKINLSANANGIYNSTISNFIINDGYSMVVEAIKDEEQNNFSLLYTGDIISSSGNKTFTIQAKDSRNRLSSLCTTKPIMFYEYSPPKIQHFSVARSSDNAKQVIAKANWQFSSINNYNLITATLYYKKASSSKWEEYGQIDRDTITTLTIEFEENSSYNFKIIITDSLLNSEDEEGFIPTIKVTLDFKEGGKGIGIGKIAESDNLEIAFDTIFIGDIYLQDAYGTKILLEDYIKSLI